MFSILRFIVSITWLAVSVGGCGYLRGLIYPDYHTQRYKTHVFVKHVREPIKNKVLAPPQPTIPYTDHPNLFQASPTNTQTDGIVDVAVIARPAGDSPQKVSPLVLQLGDRAQQALVNKFGHLQGESKKLAELIQTLRKESAGEGKAPRSLGFDLNQKVEFDIATTLNSGTDADRLDYVTTYIALDDESLSVLNHPGSSDKGS